MNQSRCDFCKKFLGDDVKVISGNVICVKCRDGFLKHLKEYKEQALKEDEDDEEKEEGL